MTSFQPTLAGGSTGRKWTPSAMLSWVITKPVEHGRVVEQPARRRVRSRSCAAARSTSRFVHLARPRGPRCLGDGVEQAVDEAALALVVEGVGDVDIFGDHRSRPGRRAGRSAHRRRRGGSRASAGRAARGSSPRPAARRSARRSRLARASAPVTMSSKKSRSASAYCVVLDRRAEPVVVEFLEQARRAACPPSPAGRAPGRRRGGRRSASGNGLRSSGGGPSRDVAGKEGRERRGDRLRRFPRREMAGVGQADDRSDPRPAASRPSSWIGSSAVSFIPQMTSVGTCDLGEGAEHPVRESARSRPAAGRPAATRGTS